MYCLFLGVPYTPRGTGHSYVYGALLVVLVLLMRTVHPQVYCSSRGVLYIPRLIGLFLGVLFIPRRTALQAVLFILRCNAHS